MPIGLPQRGDEAVRATHAGTRGTPVGFAPGAMGSESGGWRAAVALACKFSRMES
jgi:hypothetical protein